MKHVLPLPPSTNHGYHTNRGQWYKDRKVSDWETECLWRLKGTSFKQSHKECILVTRHSLVVNIGFYFGDKRRRDIDGPIKFVLDLLTKAGAYADDSLVTDLIVAKRIDKEQPRLEVEVY